MSRMAKPAFATARFIKVFDFDKHHCRHRQHQHLRDPHPALDRERLSSMVDQRHLHFPTVVRVNGPRGVEQRYAMAQRQPAAWPDLCLKAGRNFDREAGGTPGLYQLVTRK